MLDAGKQCLSDLRELEQPFEAASAKKVATAVVVPQMQVGELVLESTWRKGPFVMDCHLVRALHGLGPQLRALGVVALRFSTIHDHRYVKRGGRKSNILSRHAIGLAMDVFEVRFSDDRVLKVKRDYGSAEVLRNVEQVFAQSEQFRTPLTPGNDPRGHDDHFHLEARMPLPR